MKRKKIELEWFVYVHGLNCNGFRKENVFNNIKFEEYTIKHLKECSTKEEFAERISRELFLLKPPTFALLLTVLPVHK